MDRIGVRRRWVAGLLSLALPGLGHLYDGAPGLAACAFGVFALIAAAGPAVAWASFAGMAAALAAGVVWAAAVAAHAAIRARRTGEARLGWYQRWPVYLLVLLAAHVGLRAAFDHLGRPLFRFRAYNLPTATMADAVRRGEVVVADMAWYRDRVPARGDVVVLRFPPDPSKDVIKRCVGLPGETVAIERKRVSVDGRLLQEPYAVRAAPGPCPPSPAPGSALARRDDLPPYRVPERAVFALGDSRDNSVDSRFWGAVDYGSIRGKALYICWSRDLARLGAPVR